MSYADPLTQRSMVLDDWRNSFYERALARVVTPETIVLDAGSGLGVLGFIAASLGARKVYLVEPATNLEAAKQIAVTNGFQDRIEFIRQTVEQAVIPEKVDVITSVFTGNFLLEEDFLPILFRARDRFLKAGGVLLPGVGRMKIVPVSMPEYYDQQIGCWTNKQGRVNHSSMHRFAVNQIYYDSFTPQKFQKLSDDALVAELDFYSAHTAGCDADISMTVTGSGPLHGFLGWFDISFDEEWLSTSPEAHATHWSQAYLPVDPVVQVTEGDVLSLKLHRPEYGEWSWTLEHRGCHFRHSTFLSTPFTPAELERKSQNFHPRINEEGEVVKMILAALDGRKTTYEISLLVQEKFPEQFPDESAALKFVRNLVERFGA